MTKSTNRALIKQAVVAAQANRRQSTSHVKTRGEVSGGGKKPWRQKGTGRARAGSSRSPIWIGGGIVFGPTKERHHKQKLTKKMRVAALGELFNHLNSEKKLIVVASLGLKEIKTQSVAKLLAEHSLTAKNVTFITSDYQQNLHISARNIAKTRVVQNSQVSVLDLADAHAVIIEQKAAEERGLVKPVKATAEPAKAKK